MGRYLPANRVPAGLFSGDCLRLPDSLCPAYCAELHPRELPAGLASQFSSEISTEAVQSEAELLGLPRHARPSLLHLALAAIPHEEKITGGDGDKTLRHFARRFAVSCARVQLCLLGTRPGLADVADDLLAFFSEGKVAVLEAPCGAGAASLALVETLRARRHGGVLPRQPLEVRCLGADLETAALDLYSSMLSRVEKEAEGVRVHADATQWDACRADSTVLLGLESHGSIGTLILQVGDDEQAFLHGDWRMVAEIADAFEGERVEVVEGEGSPWGAHAIGPLDAYFG